MSIKKKKKDKKGKVKAKLKNIAKGKISAKMYKGGSRSKVSAPASRTVSSFTPGSKVAVDKQIERETGSIKDIQANEADLKWLTGFKDAYDRAGGKAFKYQGKKYDSSDKRMGDIVTTMISKLSGGGGGGDKLFTDFTEDYVKFVKGELGPHWAMFEDAYRKDPNSHFGKMALDLLGRSSIQSEYTNKTGNSPKVSGGGNQGSGFSKGYQSYVQSKFSKQIGSGTITAEKIMNDPKVQQSYTAETGNKP